MHGKRATYQRQPPDTVNSKDAARLLSMTPDSFHALTLNATFPRPISESGEPRWHADELESWRAQQLFKRRYSTR